MFNPSQFQVNEAWIVFKLNDAPVVTEAERNKIFVDRVPEDQLLTFIGEARDGFQQHVSGDRVQ